MIWPEDLEYPPDDEHPFYNDISNNIRILMNGENNTVVVIDPTYSFKTLEYADPFNNDGIEFPHVRSITLSIKQMMATDVFGKKWQWSVAVDDKGRFVSTSEKPVRGPNDRELHVW